MARADISVLPVSGLRVSPLGLGTLAFGEDHDLGPRVETSKAVLTDYGCE